ncbi:MAG: universal stress protein [Syntrophales bacterium]|nr:universal stress protein [Syntrophales bacterium]
MFAPKNILVPTDFSQYSDAALQEAVDIAIKFGANIFLLHVIPQHFRQCWEDYCLSDESVDQIDKASLEGAIDKLGKEADAIANNKNVKISFDVKAGVPYEVILSEQEARKIDLIVISSHGRTGILEYLIGSVADKVIKGAKCNVILVKPEGADPSIRPS